MATPLTKVARLIERLSKELQITPRQTEIMLTILELKSVTADDLASVYDLRESTLGKHVLALMSKGYIEQHDDADYDLFIIDRVHADMIKAVVKKHLARVDFMCRRLANEHADRERV